MWINSRPISNGKKKASKSYSLLCELQFNSIEKNILFNSRMKATSKLKKTFSLIYGIEPFACTSHSYNENPNSMRFGCEIKIYEQKEQLFIVVQFIRR